MGDTFFATGYPFVDVSSGGHVNGIIGVADRVLAMCKPTTIVIPGHGPTDLTKKHFGMILRMLATAGFDRAKARADILAT